ncbi:MAG: complex I subunit 1 family protein [Fervidicoccaceae archaeon]
MSELALEALLRTLVFPGLLFATIFALFLQWVERKSVARIQWRIGPKFTGPRGLLQPLYDFLKLLTKREIVPEGADPLLFRLAPAISLGVPVFGLALLPLSGIKSPLGFEGDFVLMLFVLSFGAFAMALAGFAVLSPYTSVGVGRHVLQYSVYEALLSIALILAALQAKALSMEGVLSYQAQHGPLLIYQPLGFVAALLALMAKLEKQPFDLPEAKQEIVGGWLTEYSGRGLAFLKLYKDLMLFFGASLMAVAYLGGPLGPGHDAAPIIGTAYFLLKVLLISLLIFVVRGIAARIRVLALGEYFWVRLAPLLLAQAALVLLVLR